MAYIDAHRHDVVDGVRGLEPICAALKKAGVQIAPSTCGADERVNRR